MKPTSSSAERTRREQGLVGRLVAATMLVGVATAVIGIVLVAHSARASVRAQVATTTTQAAGRFAAAIDEKIRAVENVARLLVSRPGIIDPAIADTELGAALRILPAFERLTLYGADGTPVAARSDHELVDLRAVPPDRDLIERVSARNAISRVIIAHDPLLAIGIGIEDPSGVIGALTVEVPLETLTAPLVTTASPTDRIAFLLDEDGRVLVHPERNRVIAGEVVDAGTLDRDGAVVATAPLTEFTGTLVVQTPASVVSAITGTTTLRLVLILFAVIAMMLVGASLVARRFLRPLGPLASAVTAFGRGDRTARAPAEAPAELGMLSRSFNGMADALGEQMDHLHWAMGTLRASEERFRSAFENAPIGMALTDTSGVIEKVNGAFATLAGRAEARLIGYPFPALLHPDDGPRNAKTLQQLVGAPEETVTVDTRVITGAGAEAWSVISLSCIVDQDGVATGFLIQALDITERKHALDAVHESERMYAASYERERRAADKLRSLDTMKNTFLNAVSHELRTPLTSILGFAELLEARWDELGDQRREIVQRLAGNSRRLDELLKDLLDIDRLSRGILEPRYRDVDLCALAAHLLEREELFAGRSIGSDVPALSVRADPGMIERVLENLLTNAVKHTPPEARIWVRARERADGIELAVDDDGPGVPPDQRDAIFEAFHRDSPENASGTGIGLTLVARLTELHGGRAWVERSPEGGASFRVLLPKATRPSVVVRAHRSTEVVERARSG